MLSHILLIVSAFLFLVGSGLMGLSDIISIWILSIPLYIGSILVFIAIGLDYKRGMYK